MKKKDKVTVKVEGHDPYEDAIDELATMVTEGLQDQPVSDLEPLEAYAARMKAKIHSNMDEFRSRFVKGYQVLLKELEKENPPKEPPGSLHL